MYESRHCNPPSPTLDCVSATLWLARKFVQLFLKILGFVDVGHAGRTPGCNFERVMGMRRHLGWAVTGILLLGVSASWISDAAAQAAKAPAKTSSTADAGAAAPSSTAAATPAPSAPTTAAAASPSSSASPAAASSSAAPTTASPPMDGATYAVRLRDLEQRVDELKDQIRRSHTRLSLLSDTILSGGMAGSRSEVVFRNEMSTAFKLIRALFVIDGAVQYNKQDETGALSDQKEIPIFTGSVPPGDHTVQVSLQFQGNGYGVFTYLRGYKFDVKGTHSFTAVEGKSLTLLVTALERGGVTTPLSERPAVDWQEKLGPLSSPTPAAAPASTGGMAAPAVSGGVSIGGGSK